MKKKQSNDPRREEAEEKNNLHTSAVGFDWMSGILSEIKF